MKKALTVIAITALAAFVFTACPTVIDETGSGHTHTWDWSVKTPGGGIALDLGIETCTDCGKTRNECYFVTGEADLVLLSALAYSGNTYAGKTILQTADITLSDYWTPISGFFGTYDGNGMSISGLAINSAQDDYWGFFRLNYGTVKNLTLSGVTIVGKGCIGGVAAENQGTVQDCHVSGYVYGSGDGRTGGVAGYNRGKVIGCSVSSFISGANNTGGVAGYNSGTVTSCSVTGYGVTGADYTGGVAGYNSGTVTGCSFTGYSVTGVKNAGGVAGGGPSGSKVIDCHASGAISATVEEAGGVVGYLFGGEVSNCYATGTVYSLNFAGGVVGFNISGKVTNCVALNTSISGGGYLGRVTSYNLSGVITNNYASSAMTAGGSTVTAGTGAATIHGESVDAADYNTQAWWTTAANWNTAAWDFSASSAWKWDNTLKLPVFK